jgi:hypothetical protein
VVVSENSLMLVGFATSNSIYNVYGSAPLTSNSVLLPFRDILYSVRVPGSTPPYLSLFGESALAIALSGKICVMRFPDKICYGRSEGVQFIKNNELLDTPCEWTVIKGIHARHFAWWNDNVIVDCGKQIHVISGSTIDFTIDVPQMACSISVSSSKLLIAFDSSFAIHSLQAKGTMISSSNFGTHIKIALWLNS